MENSEKAEKVEGQYYQKTASALAAKLLPLPKWGNSSEFQNYNLYCPSQISLRSVKKQPSSWGTENKNLDNS